MVHVVKYKPPWFINQLVSENIFYTTVVYDLRMSREDPQMKIRLPIELKESVESAAKSAGRTMNAEIVARLQSSFNEAGMQFSRAVSSDDSDTFFELIRTQRKTIDTQEAAILTLQSYLVDVINTLPKKLQSDGHVKIATKFALELGDGAESRSFQMPLTIGRANLPENAQATVREKVVDAINVPAPSHKNLVRRTHDKPRK